MNDEARQALRRLPSVDELLQTPAVRQLLEGNPREQVVEAVREAVARVRERVSSGAFPDTWAAVSEPESLSTATAEILRRWSRPHLRRVVNATGVVVHTNLGRSILAPSAIARVVEVAGAYSNLEYDIDAGVRGSRHDHIDALLSRLTGAEAAMVVNNNAAAVLLTLSVLAAGKEVVVSRGQLVEIGGSFRIPDIMRMSGARLVEVGTTNKTRIGDYEAALTGETALLLRVHTSNFKVVGFTEEASIAEIASLGRRWGLPVADDLGSGALLPLEAFRDEPPASASLQAGADVVMFSGDKLLGGPQAGILVGRAETITRLRQHPLARALRVDKMTLAALEATLQLYRDPERARREIPTLRFLDRRSEETAALAAALRTRLEAAVRAAGLKAEVGIQETAAKAGGGSLPLLEIPSHGVTVRSEVGSVVALETALRAAPVPIVGRVAQDAVVLDVLALDEADLSEVADGVVWALGQAACPPSDTPDCRAHA